ncbi:hypothetical protein GOA58_29510 [Sinorhizobium meliloti]|nr:hypothetical protein [Sinorhizobium meliloti]MDW9662837.1 hypothetical protein [Sinorhizobium meliloti]MDX0052174.1 hypothetical protein [Sinorhizobium meliloti]MQW13115.1 hypothetical protein [Sinorhizobium meliloti]
MNPDHQGPWSKNEAYATVIWILDAMTQSNVRCLRHLATSIFYGLCTGFGPRLSHR